LTGRDRQTLRQQAPQTSVLELVGDHEGHLGAGGWRQALKAGDADDCGAHHGQKGVTVDGVHRAEMLCLVRPQMGVDAEEPSVHRLETETLVELDQPGDVARLDRSEGHSGPVSQLGRRPGELGVHGRDHTDDSDSRGERAREAKVPYLRAKVLTYGPVMWPTGLDFGADARRVLNDTIAATLGDSPSIEVTTMVIEGLASPTLLEVAAGATLLVVGSRGHGAFLGTVLGSVSEHCVRHAPCPVVVVDETAAPEVPCAKMDHEHLVGAADAAVLPAVVAGR
jgi:nucleotide-binding universal stress UspA family protein